VPTYGVGSSHVPSPRRKAWEEFEACWGALISLGGTVEEIETKLAEIEARARELQENFRKIIMRVIKALRDRLPKKQPKVTFVAYAGDIPPDMKMGLPNALKTLRFNSDRLVYDREFWAGDPASLEDCFTYPRKPPIDDLFIIAHGEWLSKEEALEKPGFHLSGILGEEVVKICGKYLASGGTTHILACRISYIWLVAVGNKYGVNVSKNVPLMRDPLFAQDAIQYLFVVHGVSYK